MKEMGIQKLKIICVTIFACLFLVCMTIELVQNAQIQAERDAKEIKLLKEKDRPLKVWEKNKK